MTLTKLKKLKKLTNSYFVASYKSVNETLKCIAFVFCDVFGHIHIHTRK